MILFLHHVGVFFWIAALLVYLVLSYKKMDFLTEGYRIYFKRKFTGFAIFGFVLIFGTGMALIITQGMVGSAVGQSLISTKMIWKFSGALLVFLCGINAWGIDVGMVKRIDELKVLKTEVTKEHLAERIAKLNVLLNIFLWLSLIITFVVFYISINF